MYFILKYIDYHQFRKRSEHHPASSIQIKKSKVEEIRSSISTKGSKSRVRSLSGSKPSIGGIALESTHELNASSASSLENKEVLINPDCYLGSILDYICEVVGLPKNIYFTMCTATSELLAVGDSPLSTPGLEFFIPRETYYIIMKDYDQSGNEISFPLLRKNTEIYSYFMTKLRDGFVEHQKKASNASSISSKLKSKEATKAKTRVKSANPQKEGKDQNLSSPFTKHRNSTASPSAKQRNSMALPNTKQRNSTASPLTKQRNSTALPPIKQKK